MTTKTIELNGDGIYTVSVGDSTGTYTTSVPSNSISFANLNIDLTSISGWSSLAMGSHTLKVKAKATNYIDSEFSAIVDFIKGMIVIPGGTATLVVTTTYSSAEEEALKTEIISTGHFTAEELSNASILNITGATPGTVALDVSALGSVGDYIKIIHKKTSDSQWETLFSGAIPSNKKVLVTITEFSPIVGAELSSYNVSTDLTNVTADPNNPTSMYSSESATFVFYTNGNNDLPSSITVTGATVTSWTIVNYYPITATLTNITAASSNPTMMNFGETATLIFTANAGFKLPNSVTVLGAASSWNSSSGVLTLSNPYSVITISIDGVPDIPENTLETVDGKAFLTSNGDYFITATSYLNDSDGNRLADSNGNRLAHL